MTALDELRKLEELFTAYRDAWHGKANVRDVTPEDVWHAALVDVQRSIKNVEDDHANG